MKKGAARGPERSVDAHPSCMGCFLSSFRGFLTFFRFVVRSRKCSRLNGMDGKEPPHFLGDPLRLGNERQMPAPRQRHLP